MKKWLQVGCAIVLGVFLVACRGNAPEPTQARLESRVQGYISARHARDREVLRQYFLDPNQARVGNISYLESRIDKITLKDKEAQVELRNRFQAMGFIFKDVPQKLKWRWEKNDWYLVVDTRSNPFLRKQGARGADKKVPAADGK